MLAHTHTPENELVFCVPKWLVYVIFFSREDGHILIVPTIWSFTECLVTVNITGGISKIKWILLSSY